MASRRGGGGGGDGKDEQDKVMGEEEEDKFEELQQVVVGGGGDAGDDGDNADEDKEDGAADEDINLADAARAFSSQDDLRQQPSALIKSYSIAMEVKARKKIEVVPLECVQDEKLADMFKELEVDGERNVFTKTGALIGEMDADNVLIAKDGSVLGYISDGKHQPLLAAAARNGKADDNAWLLPPAIHAPASDAIEQYLRVPQVYNDLQDNGGGVSLEGYCSVQKKKKQKKIVNNVFDSVSPIKEPEEGIYPLGFDVVEFEKSRRQVEWQEFTPTVFSRKQILPPEQLPKQQVLTDVNTFFTVCNREVQGERFTFLWIDGLRKVLPKQVKATLGRYLRLLPNLEVLGLRGAGIHHLEHLKLPKLLLLDVSHNEIRDFNVVGLMTVHSRKLRQLNIKSNPIMRSGWKEDLPSINNEFWKVILNLSQLEILNEQVIPNVDRSRAMEKYAVKSQVKRVPMTLWNIAMNSLLAASGMKMWNPELIERLELSGQGLRIIHVGMMKNLKFMDVSNNFISSIIGSGLEQCTKLQHLDLQNNLISQQKGQGNPLKPLRHLSSLRVLYLSGNPMRDYHASVIYLTLHLKGTNRNPGLQELDGSKVSIEDKIKSLYACSPAADLDRERWRLNLISNFGNLQMRSVENMFGKVKQLKLVDRNLREVYLDDFVSLEILDLSKNKLKLARGLENCRRLRVLNLSENISLNIPRTLKQLKNAPCTKLETINLAVDPKKLDHRQYITILAQVCMENRGIEVINEIPISVEDRVAVFQSNMRSLNVPKYKLNLALTVSAAEKVESYHPDDVAIGLQYKPAEVTELLELTHLNLADVDVDFSSFTNLERLNLANNKLTDLMTIGIENLKQLKWLDVRNNKIVNSPSQIGGLIDRLESLEVLAIRGNPCMHNRRDRLRILKSITRVQDFECGFRVLDTEITVAERIEAWAERGDVKESPDVLQYKAAIRLRSPANVQPELLLGLDLSDIGLRLLDVSPFVNLKKLKLTNNKLSLLNGTGIGKLRDLMVVDLRKNDLSSVDDLVDNLGRLKNLEYIGIAGNRFSSSIRTVILERLPVVRTIDNRIMYIDDTFVSVAEVLSAISDEFRERAQENRFKWDLSLRRQLPLKDIKNPKEVRTINLAGNSLSYILLSWLPELQELNLSKNKITVDDLKISGIEKLDKLQKLDLSHNDLHRLDEVVKTISKLPALEEFNVVGNRCYYDDSQRSRIELLKLWEGIGSANFKLKVLNGKPLDVNERLQAVQGALSQRDAERIKLELVISNMGDPANVRSLDISHQGFTYIDGVQRLRFLQSLTVSHNTIKSLSDQYLHELPLLSEIDISYNQIESIDEILTALSSCHSLRHVHMIQSTQDEDETRHPEKYLSLVGSRLRGVETIDGKLNPVQWNAVQKDAQMWLFELANVGPNGCIHVDISNRNLPSGAFFLVLCALKELGSVVSLKANGNLWNKGKDRIRNYRQYVVYALGGNLKVLDGEAVLDDERRNALDSIEEEEAKGIKLLKKNGWVNCKDEAAEVLSKVQKERQDEQKKQEAGPDLFDAGANPTKQFASGPRREDAVGAAGAGNGIGNTASSIIHTLSGTLLTKFEIIINFLQVYSLILVIDLNVPWPKIYIDFSKWIRLFSFDIDWIFMIDLGYEQQMKFLFTACLPALFGILYWGTTKADIQSWKDRFVERWNRTRQLLFAFLLVSLLIVIGLGFFLYPASISQVRSGGQPLPETMGFIFVIGSLVMVVFAIYYLIALTFRNNYVGVAEEKFQRWWFQKLYQLRRLSLFSLTVLFMPVARLIFLQFSCVRDPRTGRTRLEIYADRPCPGQKIFLIQIISIIFGAMYIIGIPYLFRRLISTAVKMVDAHGYKDEENLYKNMLNRKANKDPDGIRSKKYRELETEAQVHLRQFYFNEVKNNPMPQTYLYSAYERRFRYFKIFQMFQKLLIVLVTMFVPDTIQRNISGAAKVFVSSILVSFFAAVSVAFRPFNDNYEDIMDIVAQITNSLNLIIAVLLKLGLFAGDISGAVLILINVAVLLFFLVILLGGPVRQCIQKLRNKNAKYDELKQQPNAAELAVEQEAELEIQERAKLLAGEAADRRLATKK